MATQPASTKSSLQQRLTARARTQFADMAATLTDGGHLPLCRLRYGGSASRWGFAVYRASHDDYEPSMPPSGEFAGIPEEALDCACGLYLGDPTATPRIARRGVDSSQRLGRHRWKVERSLAWLLANRRLTVRYERRADILLAFLHLACVPICAYKLRPLSTHACSDAGSRDEPNASRGLLPDIARSRVDGGLPFK